MNFVPARQQWIADHVQGVPARVAAMIGDIGGKTLLDVGCGDMMTDLGYLAAGAKAVHGLDIAPIAEQQLLRTIDEVRRAGFAVPLNVRAGLHHHSYDGSNFPFEDNSFETVISWGTFEHVADVPKVLREMRRVLRPDGVCLITVFPWFHSFYGSHLTDFIKEPFFHLKRSDEWVLQKLNDYCDEHPDQRDFLTGYMFREYKALNRYSASMFADAVRAAGWREQRWKLLAYDQDLTEAPSDVPFADLMVCGSDVVLRK